MDDDEPAAAREKLIQVLAIGRIDVPRLLFVEDEHVRLGELRLGGEVVRASCPGAALVEQRHPFLEKPRIIVRPRTV